MNEQSDESKEEEVIDGGRVGSETQKLVPS